MSDSLREAAYALERADKLWWQGEGGRKEDVLHRMAVLLVEIALATEVDDDE